MSVINAAPLLASAGGEYQISRSVRLRSSASAYFSRTFSASPTTRTKAVLSAWVKRGQLGTNQMIMSGYDGTSSLRTSFYFNTSDQLTFELGGSTLNNVVSTQVFRDPGAFYHLVLVIDTTQATAANRVLIIVNGVQVTAFATANYPAQNALHQYAFGNALNYIGTLAGGSYFLDGYLSDFHFIDGQAPAFAHLQFGETDSITGVWKPKAYTGTYGTNGFRLDFSDPSAGATGIGKDRAGSNNWTPNNISLTAGATYDSMLDVPTAYFDGGNGRGNYAVMNPLQLATSSGFAVSDSNLKVSGTASGNATQARGTIAVSSGKWYWEILRSDSVTTAGPLVGVVIADASQNTYVGSSSLSWTYYSQTGNKFNAAAGSAYGATWGVNDVVGVALDMDAGTIAFYKNGVSQGTAFTNLAGNTVAPLISGDQSGGVFTANFNFGQRPFSYTPPTGFKALHTGNLPEPTIKKGNQYFDATTYTGNGTSQSILNAGGFQPDLVWVKSRSLAQPHTVADSVRGANNYLVTNATDAEATSSAKISSINSNGFTAGSDVAVNTNGQTFVAWQWKEGATPGFDVVTYTGNGGTQNVSHALGVKPAMIILKRRDGGSGYSWPVYHKAIGASAYVYLERTDAQSTVSAANTWGNNSATVEPTSSVFTIGSAGSWNANTGSYVAYLFSEVPGFSKFGSYTGNGSADGVFVHLGFRPRFVLVKRTTGTATDWEIHDAARNAYNVADTTLRPNSSSAEFSYAAMDFTSNGFKLRDTSVTSNSSGDTFIFAAFAENPFKYSLAR